MQAQNRKILYFGGYLKKSFPRRYKFVYSAYKLLQLKNKYFTDGDMKMMIFSTKITKAKILTLALVCSCIALLVIVSIPSKDASANTTNVNYAAKTNEDRVKFLEKFGWEVDANPTETVDVVIPTTFDSTYETYNKMQKGQGLDLEGYKGKKAVRYTYTINNYPTKQESPVQANLIVLDDKIVAGDVTSTAMGGFMHGFARPTTANDNSKTENNNNEQNQNATESGAMTETEGRAQDIVAQYGAKK